MLSGLDDYEGQSVKGMNNRNDLLLGLVDHDSILPSGIKKWSQGVLSSVDILSQGPSALNDRGEIVGSKFFSDFARAVIIRNGQTLRLDTMISPAVNLTDFVIYEASRLTNNGEIMVKYAHRPPPSENPQQYFIYRYGVLLPNCN